MSETMNYDVITEVGFQPFVSRALDAELALQRSLSVYRGKAKHEDAFAMIRCAAHIYT